MFFCCFSGAKPQIVPTIMCVNIPMELFALAIRADGISLGEHAPAFGRVPHVLQVNIDLRSYKIFRHADMCVYVWSAVEEAGGTHK